MEERNQVSRARREAVAFPVRFYVTGERGLTGTCENLSESGLLALFTEPLDIWTEGSVDLQFGEGLLGIRARVARVVGHRAGLAFLALEEQHRVKLREMIASASSSGHLPDHL